MHCLRQDYYAIATVRLEHDLSERLMLRIEITKVAASMAHQNDIIRKLRAAKRMK